ncbi:MAG: membrane-bound lytic murein transglycosylase MltF [Bdellovibrionaceae bacterium]|nr:membrane-bound lytic murein transglycosylase MltF [Pseudobdellovibrionaceae bacterium]
MGFSEKLGRLGAAFGLSVFVTTMNGCEGMSWGEATLAAKVQSQGEIRVLTLEHPLVDESQGAGGRQGMERELLLHFADTYQLKIRFIRKKNLDDLYDSLRRGEGDVGAARLWMNEQPNQFSSGPAFEESHLSLFCRRRLKIAHLRDLSRRRVGLAGKDNVQSLDTRLRYLVPDVELQLRPLGRARSLIRDVAEGRLDCAVTENLEGAQFSRAWPQVEKVTALTENRSLAWVVRPQRTDLAALMRAWFQRASRDDEIMRIEDPYRASLSSLDMADTRRFLVNLRQRLPRFKESFLESAREHGLDWRLVASIAYQESHWNPEARSYTGVLGIMQLTQETADDVGIEDRTDPQQSIWGGSYYIRFLLNRMPKAVNSQERTALALAAYNCGLAHLRDAQGLAIERGLNPYSWRHLKTVLPLLENPEIAARLPAGAARGRETVQFVERVRSFHDLWRMVD